MVVQQAMEPHLFEVMFSSYREESHQSIKDTMKMGETDFFISFCSIENSEDTEPGEEGFVSGKAGESAY